MDANVRVQVTSYVDLMHEYGVPVPDIQAASYATMDSDYTALRDAMWSGAWSHASLSSLHLFMKDLRGDQVKMVVAW